MLPANRDVDQSFIGDSCDVHSKNSRDWKQVRSAQSRGPCRHRQAPTCSLGVPVRLRRRVYPHRHRVAAAHRAVLRLPANRSCDGDHSEAQQDARALRTSRFQRHDYAEWRSISSAGACEFGRCARREVPADKVSDGEHTNRRSRKQIRQTGCGRILRRDNVRPREMDLSV